MAFIILATILVFTSCAKETLILPETDNSELVINQDADFTTSEVSYISKTTENETSEKSRVTVKLQATVTSVSQVANEYFVNFAVNHDCTKSVVVANQTLDFTDASGKLVMLTLRVNSYTGSNGALQIVFDLSGHDLSGLSLQAAQEIIIEEQMIN